MCRECGKGYSVPRNLIIHMKTHTGQKPYSCNYCTTRFNSKVNMVAHVRSHEADKYQKEQKLLLKQYDCISIGRNDVLQSGDENQEKNCSICVKGFTQISDLSTHMALIHKAETVNSKCFFCVRGFLKVKDLDVHCTTHQERKASCSCVH